MEQSILNSTKKVLQIGPEDLSFDLDILTHINDAFSTLNDLGVGPAEGFVIEDSDAEWGDYLSDNLPILSKVKTFVFLHTRLLFDPPAMSFLIESMRSQINECLSRISMRYEAINWVDPDPPELIVIDGE